MSFSFILKEEDITSTLSAAIDDKIAQIPNPTGKAEAESLASMLPDAVVALGNSEKAFSSVSISGSASSGAASLSIHVSYKQEPATPTVVEEPALSMDNEAPAPTQPETIDTSKQGKKVDVPSGKPTEATPKKP